jgi:tetratricopeptide (TPR) repeat protein
MKNKDRSRNVEVTRRQAIAAGLASGLAVSQSVIAATDPQVGEKKALVGKIVLRRYFVTTARPLETSEQSERHGNLFVLAEASYTGKAEKDGMLEILDTDGTLAEVKADSMIPLSEAVEFFSVQIKEEPKNTFALLSRGWAHYLLRSLAQAATDMTEFLRLTPADAVQPALLPPRWDGLVERGLVYAEQGEFEKAFKDFEEGIEAFPWNMDVWMNRGYTYDLMGEYRKAIEDCDSALKIASSHLMPKNNKAWVLATCPDQNVRDAARAIQLAKEVCTATRNQEGMYLDTLAAAYAAAGKYDDAVKMQEKALEDTAFLTRYAEGGRERKQLYMQKKPYRSEPVKKP